MAYKLGTVAGPRVTVKLPWKIKVKTKTGTKEKFALCYMKKEVADILKFNVAKDGNDGLYYTVGSGNKQVTHIRKGTMSGKVYKVIFLPNREPSLKSGKDGKKSKKFSSVSFNVPQQIRTFNLVKYLKDNVKSAQFLVTPDGKKIDLNLE